MWWCWSIAAVTARRDSRNERRPWDEMKCTETGKVRKDEGRGGGSSDGSEWIALNVKERGGLCDSEREGGRVSWFQPECLCVPLEFSVARKSVCSGNQNDADVSLCLKVNLQKYACTAQHAPTPVHGVHRTATIVQRGKIVRSSVSLHNKK